MDKKFIIIPIANNTKEIRVIELIIPSIILKNFVSIFIDKLYPN